MRISTQQIFGNGVSSMQKLSAQQQMTQQQIASGKRVLNPADDPAAATRILQMTDEIARIEQFKKNVDSVDNRLKQEDATLGSITDVLTRVRELAIQSGDGALSAEDRKFIAAELRQRLEQMAGLMNTRDATGEYIFAGHQGGKPAFAQDATGTWRYQGDEGQRQMQVDSDLRVPVGDNGKRLFVNIPSAGLAFETRASIANTATPPATISPGMVIDKDVYASYYPRDMQVTIGEVPVDPLAPLGPQKLVYSIKDPASGRVLVDQADYQDNARIVVEGISFEIRGTPAPGDTFRVDASSEGTQSVTSTIERLIYGLENFAAIPEGRRAFDDLLGTTLTNLDNAQNRISEVRSEVGARMNTLDTTRDFLAESKQLVQEKLADLRDLDYTEAISRLAMENFILQAAQQSYVQVSRLSLFDRL